ncbi:MAG: DUF3592 domain-containing protein [Gammaproteobacteria bacterium]|nr:DUF3592 domain-containing protein [Gammaproteobacteria bacterium]
MSQQPSPQDLLGGSFVTSIIKAALGFMAFIFILVGGIACESGLSSIHEGTDTETWPASSGVITASKIDTETHAYRSASNKLESSISYTPVLVYDYQVDGKMFTGTVIYKSFAHALEFIAEGYIEQYAVGSAVTVYYNPDDPEDAVLEPGFKIFSHYFAFTFFGGLFALIGVGILVVAFRAERIFGMKQRPGID